MNCYRCDKRIPAEDAVIVVAPDEARSFCEYRCAGIWALEHSFKLKHILFFDGGKGKAPKLSRLITRRKK